MSDQPARVCAMCCTRQPITDMAPRADSWECTDPAACQARADASGIYPVSDTGSQWAPAGPADVPVMATPDQAAADSHRALARTAAAERAADAGRTVPQEVLDLR